MNIKVVKLLTAAARRAKRVRKIRHKIRRILQAKNSIDKIIPLPLENEFVLIASSTFGNEKISEIDLKIKRMLDEHGIKNTLFYCGGGLTACSMREEEKIDLQS